MQLRLHLYGIGGLALQDLVFGPARYCLLKVVVVFSRGIQLSPARLLLPFLTSLLP